MDMCRMEAKVSDIVPNSGEQPDMISNVVRVHGRGLHDSR